MLHTYKLTPDYFIRRAFKAKNLSELVDANLGLYNLYKRHSEYQYQKLMESIFGSKHRAKLREFS
jgi:hypothetical protein